MYLGKGPHIQMILFDTTTHRPLGVVVFGGSVCLEWLVNGSPTRECDMESCCFWHAPLGSLHSDLIRAEGTHRLMQTQDAELRSLLRRISKSLNQSVYELGKQQKDELAALVAQNKRIELSTNRALFARRLLLRAEEEEKTGFIKRMILEDAIHSCGADRDTQRRFEDDRNPGGQ